MIHAEGSMHCCVDGCSSEPKKRGLCQAHYSKFYRTGELEKYASEPARGSYRVRPVADCPGVSVCGRDHLARGFCSPCYQSRKLRGAIENKPPVNVGLQCSVAGCANEARSLGYCQAHYEKFRKYGDPLAYAPKRTGCQCSVDGCAGISIARGLCRRCYAAWRKHGDPKGRSEAFLRRGRDKIDDQGYVQVYAPGHPNARKSNRLPMHRLVMSQFLGRPLKKNENVHHINGDKTDNRGENLELWITAQPKGQRPQDLIEYAKRILRTYAKDSEKLSKLTRGKPKPEAT